MVRVIDDVLGELQDAAKAHRVHVKKNEHHDQEHHPNVHRKRKHDGVC